jgi:hypothetical protein
MMAIHEDCCETLEKFRQVMKIYAVGDGMEAANYSEGDLVILCGKIIRMRCPCRKFTHKLYGPFKIIKIITDTVVCLNLAIK